MGLILMFVMEFAFAKTVGDIAGTITGSFEALAKLITATSYVSGAGLFMVAIFQFRQHKENPTQTPLSKPMLFLAIAAALLFFPTVVGITEGTIFGKAVTGGPTGKVLPTSG
jgi:intracellular multiplication protein IcmD